MLPLQRGYSITFCGNRIVKDITDLKEGDVLTTKMKQGEIQSKILSEILRGLLFSILKQQCLQ